MSTLEDVARSRASSIIPDLQHGKMPDGSRVYVAADAHGSIMRIPATQYAHDLFVLLHVYDNGNGTMGADWVGWVSQGELTRNRYVKGDRCFKIKKKDLHLPDTWPMRPERQKPERRVDHQPSLDGDDITLIWGWQGKSVQVRRGNIVIGFAYQNGERGEWIIDGQSRTTTSAQKAIQRITTTSNKS